MEAEWVREEGRDGWWESEEREESDWREVGAEAEGRRDWRAAEADRDWRLDREVRLMEALAVSKEAEAGLLCCFCDSERRVLWLDCTLCALLTLSADKAERGALSSVMADTEKREMWALVLVSDESMVRRYRAADRIRGEAQQAAAQELAATRRVSV